MNQYSIEFCGVQLPIIKCEDEKDRVQFKSLSDAIGINWDSQKRTILKKDYLVSRYGVILGGTRTPQSDEKRPTKEHYLVRVDRIEAFLFNLNPQNIIAKGNIDGAEWLIKKQDEWADVLHKYEQFGVIVKKTHESFRKELKTLDSITDPTTKNIYVKSLNKDYGDDLRLPEQDQIPI